MPEFDEKKLHDKAAVIYEMLLVQCDKVLGKEPSLADLPYGSGVAAAHQSLNALGRVILPDVLLLTFYLLSRKAGDWALERFGPDTDNTFSDGFHAFSECFAMVLSDESL